MRRKDLTVGQTVTHAAGVEGVIEWVGWTMVGISRESMVGIVAEWLIADLVAHAQPKAKPGQLYKDGMARLRVGLLDGRVMGPSGFIEPFDPTHMLACPVENEK